jgi:hypothetical protein
VDDKIVIIKKNNTRELTELLKGWKIKFNERLLDNRYNHCVGRNPWEKKKICVRLVN